MNTPYPTRTLSRATILALSVWNAGVQRSQRAYEKQPTAACIEPDCDQLGRVEAGFCAEHAIKAELCIECQVKPPMNSNTFCSRCNYRQRSTAGRMRPRRAKGEQ